MKISKLKKVIVSFSLFLSLILWNNFNAQAQQQQCRNPRLPNYGGDCACLGIGCPIDDYVPYIVIGIVLLGITRLKSVKAQPGILKLKLQRWC